MRSIVIGGLGVIVSALSGCATLNSEEAFQNAAAQKQECKVVTLYSASETLRLQNLKGRDGSAMEQTEGSLDIGRANLNPPRDLRTTLPKFERTTNQLQRDC